MIGSVRNLLWNLPDEVIDRFAAGRIELSMENGELRIRVLRKVSYVCKRCGTEHYEGEFEVCCEFDDMGGNER